MLHPWSQSRRIYSKVNLVILERESGISEAIFFGLFHTLGFHRERYGYWRRSCSRCGWCAGSAVRLCFAGVNLLSGSCLRGFLRRCLGF